MGVICNPELMPSSQKDLNPAAYFFGIARFAKWYFLSPKKLAMVHRVRFIFVLYGDFLNAWPKT
jgi:hypothetical protein